MKIEVLALIPFLEQFGFESDDLDIFDGHLDEVSGGCSSTFPAGAAGIFHRDLIMKALDAMEMESDQFEDGMAFLASAGMPADVKYFILGVDTLPLEEKEA